MARTSRGGEANSRVGEISVAGSECRVWVGRVDPLEGNLADKPCERLGAVQRDLIAREMELKGDRWMPGEGEEEGTGSTVG